MEWPGKDHWSRPELCLEGCVAKAALRPGLSQLRGLGGRSPVDEWGHFMDGWGPSAPPLPASTPTAKLGLLSVNLIRSLHPLIFLLGMID